MPSSARTASRGGTRRRSRSRPAASAARSSCRRGLPEVVVRPDVRAAGAGRPADAYEWADPVVDETGAEQVAGRIRRRVADENNRPAVVLAERVAMVGAVIGIGCAYCSPLRTAASSEAFQGARSSPRSPCDAPSSARERSGQDREPRRLDGIGREQLERDLGSPDVAARVAADVDDEPALGQQRNEPDELPNERVRVQCRRRRCGGARTARPARRWTSPRSVSVSCVSDDRGLLRLAGRVTVGSAPGPAGRRALAAGTGASLRAGHASAAGSTAWARRSSRLAVGSNRLASCSAGAGSGRRPATRSGSRGSRRLAALCRGPVADDDPQLIRRRSIAKRPET